MVISVRKFYYSINLVLLVMMLAACRGSETSALPVASNTPGRLIVYQTTTPHSPPPVEMPLFTPPVTPAATPTPYIHEVVQGETMLGIALQYGITLDELTAANPGVDPQFLSVGTGLVIPLGGEFQMSLPTPEPVSILWHAPICYPTADGGVWCFILVENNREASVENLSAWIGILDAGGGIIRSGIAVSPVNIVRPGDRIPLSIFFEPTIPGNVKVTGDILTAMDVPFEDSRYLDWPISIDTIEYHHEVVDYATITGRVEAPVGNPLPSQVWVVGVAYDQDGNMVGMRKWESAGDLSFEITVFSLGGEIHSVEVLAEIRP
jgi:LysM repeat protein